MPKRDRSPARYICPEMNLYQITMNAHRDVDLKSIAWHAMGKYGFEARFPASVIDEVNSIHAKTFSSSEKDVRDLRMLLWSSIDNYDSLDLDQLDFKQQDRHKQVCHQLRHPCDVDFDHCKTTLHRHYYAHGMELMTLQQQLVGKAWSLPHISTPATGAGSNGPQAGH